MTTVGPTGRRRRCSGSPRRRPSRVVAVDWSLDPDTVPASPHPDRSTAHYGAAAYQEPVGGRLHWASTETATEYAGHVEGAIRAGLRAADAVARSLAGR